jgi:hypothetical protein
MRKADDGLREIFHDKLRRGFDWIAIETGSTVGGVPDSNYCSEGAEGWVECKATQSNKVKFRPLQPGWCLRRSLAGGRVTIAVRFRHDGGPRKGPACDELFLYSGSRARDVTDYGLSAAPDFHTTGGPSKWNWVGVASFLRRPL